eukprot:SRR837773.1951.p2 GENE.SRR837773.1951~~SRR837773.1951.p2  ORF type:complete len:222 (+),score=38.59 SRR837773.1951:95-667(+)
MAACRDRDGALTATCSMRSDASTAVESEMAQLESLASMASGASEGAPPTLLQAGGYRATPPSRRSKVWPLLGRDGPPLMAPKRSALLERRRSRSTTGAPEAAEAPTSGPVLPAVANIELWRVPSYKEEPQGEPKSRPLAACWSGLASFLADLVAPGAGAPLPTPRLGCSHKDIAAGDEPLMAALQGRFPR